MVEHRHSAASQGIQRDKTHAKATRRRGQALEATVLKAAWEILNEVGYEQLTMAGVAKRAQATKPVLYRRWPDKASLVTQAFITYGPKLNPDLTVPDTGSLRDDLVGFFDQLLVVFNALGTEKMQGLVADRLKSIPADKLFGVANDNAIMRPKIETMLTQAESRGDLKLADQTERTLNLPTVLLINEVLSRGELTAESVAAMVDEILVPVFMGSKD
ncbi:TetR/AcrR family transcriptional regulator [Lactiplantibacillus daowaiensis]|uniref:TetR/AcrR family transcriptional regulator n=1 Tax=Lactiplantibacillus daowaiensis TaxID=2559918 RepID=A0ABW1RXG2_9LACO|nr:TetR/AcrR family transcriptional regulator [Lactiplantibacillus daowaiensis]